MVWNTFYSQELPKRLSKSYLALAEKHMTNIQRREFSFSQTLWLGVQENFLEGICQQCHHKWWLTRRQTSCYLCAYMRNVNSTMQILCIENVHLTQRTNCFSGRACMPCDTTKMSKLSSLACCNIDDEAKQRRLQFQITRSLMTSHQNVFYWLLEVNLAFVKTCAQA